jgi:hypothetical protein
MTATVSVSICSKLRLFRDVFSPVTSAVLSTGSGMISRFRPGTSPPSYDKQYVRDYLETLDWNKKPPGPALPENIVEATAAKYREAHKRLTGPSPQGGPPPEINVAF